MSKKAKPIPVNLMANEFGLGVSIERMSFANMDIVEMEQGKQTHRHDGHTFVLLERGAVSLEIDFKTYHVRPSMVVYVHPDQVHRTIASENVTLCAWTITNENLNPEYLKLLEDIMPAEPIVLDKDMFTVISEAINLSFKFSHRKSDKLYHSLLKDSCNVLVALVISQYFEHAKSSKFPSRFETVNKAFKKTLEKHFRLIKRPSEFAEQLHLSTPYLNECVKNTTGYPVSYHIQQRVILEAKRLLFHSDKSVKEISSDLGYDDYPYFSRLFHKVTGMTPLAFRSKNLD